MDALDFSVRYPFTSVAKVVLAESGMVINDRIVESGLRRLRDAVHERTTLSGAVKDIEKKEELASFAAARMILGHMRNSFLTNRFAVEEANRVKRYLERADDADADAVGKELGIEYIKHGEENHIRLPVYLRYSPRSIDYRLLNRKIANGYVVVSRRERIRLIEEAARKRIGTIPLVKGVPENIRNAAKEIMDELPKRVPIAISAKPGDHPPCIENLLEGVRKHENLNHQARWYLAVYLIAIGMSNEQIASIYANLPDYNEKTTGYQLQHARKKGYSVPSCASITTYGFCITDCRIGSPVNWHTKDMPKEVKKDAGKQ